MARIRTLKPEFWEDEIVGSLSLQARLLYLALISQADDEGRFRAHPATIRAAAFRYDEGVSTADVSKWLAELARAGKTATRPGRVTLYVVDGQTYGLIPNWSKHQKINRKQPSRLPAFTESSVIDHGALSEHSLTDLDQGSGSPTVDRGPPTVDHRPTTARRTRTARTAARVAAAPRPTVAAAADPAVEAALAGFAAIANAGGIPAALAGKAKARLVADLREHPEHDYVWWGDLARVCRLDSWTATKSLGWLLCQEQQFLDASARVSALRLGLWPPEPLAPARPESRTARLQRELEELERHSGPDPPRSGQLLLGGKTEPYELRGDA